MAGEHGVKETKEALAAIVMIGAAIAKEVKDGFDWSDLPDALATIQGDAANKAKLDAGLKDIAKAKAELGDLQVEDIAELVAHVAIQVPVVLDALKGE